MQYEHDPTELLADSVTAHGSGDMMAAAEMRMEALQLIPEDDPRRPGLLAAYAFTRRLDDPVEGLLEFAQDAYNQGHLIAHDVRRGDQDRVIAGEELSTTALHLGVLCARQAIVYHETGQEAAAENGYNYAWLKILEAASGARQMSHDKREGRQFLHQWQINTARREAAITGLNPEVSSWRGLGLAVKAVAMSPFSESHRFVSGTNPNSHASHRVRAKAKSFVGGLAAGAVCGLTLLPAQKGLKTARALARNKLVF